MFLNNECRLYFTLHCNQLFSSATFSAFCGVSFSVWTCFSSCAWTCFFSCVWERLPQSDHQDTSLGHTLLLQKWYLSCSLTSFQWMIWGSSSSFFCYKSNECRLHLLHTSHSTWHSLAPVILQCSLQCILYWHQHNLWKIDTLLAKIYGTKALNLVILA